MKAMLKDHVIAESDDIVECKGYQYFPRDTGVRWFVTQYPRQTTGFFVVKPGNGYHFLTRSINMRLHADSKAIVTFFWSNRTFEQITPAPKCAPLPRIESPT